MFHHLVALWHAVVVEHLGGERDAGDRCLQLVCHVVDEVVLDLAVALLPEDDHDGEDERDEQDDGEHHAGNHEPDTGEDIAVDVGKVNAHHAHVRCRVIAEEHLAIGVLTALITIVGTPVDLTSVLCRDGEVVRDVDAVVHQLSFDVLVEDLEVDTLFQRFVRSRVEHVHDHLIEQSLLIDISVLDDLLQRLAGRSVGVAVGAQDHSFGHLCGFHCHGLQLKRRVDGAVLARHGILMRVLHAAVVGFSASGAYAVFAVSVALGLVDVFLKITQRLVELQIAGSLIEGAVDAFVELFLLHVGHLTDVGELQAKQDDKGHAHDDGDGPNGFLLHVGKVR